jgi:hypothetical protein
MQTIRRLKVRDQVAEQIKQYVVERRRLSRYDREREPRRSGKVLLDTGIHSEKGNRR